MIGLNPFNIVGKMGAMRGAASSALWGGIKMAGRMSGNPFAHRTALGAMAGGAYGAMSDNTSIVGGALMGAGAARYGGMFLGSGMRPGIGMRGAVMRMAATARSDGRNASRFIARSYVKANNGYNKFRGLFR